MPRSRRQREPCARILHRPLDGGSCCEAGKCDASRSHSLLCGLPASTPISLPACSTEGESNAGERQLEARQPSGEWRGTRTSPLPLCSWTGRHHFHQDLICDCNANRFGTLCWKGVAAAVLSCATLCVVHGDHVDAPRERSSRLRELPGGSSLREFRGCLCHAWGPGVMPRAPT